MIRGTTPTHTFTLPFAVSMVDDVMVIYAQNDVEVFQKNTRDCVLEGNTIQTTLTQDDTLRLDHRQNVQVQLRVLTIDGTAMASRVYVMGVEQCLNDEVM